MFSISGFEYPDIENMIKKIDGFLQMQPDLEKRYHTVMNKRNQSWFNKPCIKIRDQKNKTKNQNKYDPTCYRSGGKIFRINSSQVFCIFTH